jgi:ATP-dependent Lhr-like helicase
VDLGRGEAVRGIFLIPRTIAPATRVPGASRGGHARISFATRASPSLERSGPPTVSCRWWLAGPRCGNASKGQRNRHRLVPARSGARAPLACEGRRLAGCARASYRGCRSRQASSRLREARTRWQRDSWTGAWPAGPKGHVGEKASATCPAVAMTADQVKARAGRSKERRGAKVLDPYGRHPRPLHPHVPLHAGGRAAVLATLTPVRVATGVSEARPHTSRGEDNAPRGERETGRCGPPKRISLA